MMPDYPSVSLSEAQEFYRRLAERASPEEVELARVEPKAVSVCNVNVEEITLRAVSEVRRQSQELDLPPVELEAQLIPSFYSDMMRLPVSVLSDSDFWRYICCGTTFHLWIAKRDGQKNSIPKSESYGAAGPQVDADTVAYRMFVRGDIAAQVSGAKEAPMSGVELLRLGGSDVWKSHINRTLNVLSPLALAGMLSLETVNTETARAFFPHVKRIRTNVLVDALTPQQASEFGARVRQAFLEE